MRPLSCAHRSSRASAPVSLESSRFARASPSRSPRARVGAIQPSTSSSPLLADFATWLAERGVVGKNITVAYVSGGADEAETSRGVVALKNIKADDELARLPRRAALIVTEGMDNPHPEFISDALWLAAGDGRWALRVGLVLLREYALGSASAFAPYVRQLPEVVNLIASYSDEEIRAMQYTLTEKFRREQLEENAEAIRLVRKHADATSALSSMSDERVIWAMDCVRSRVFSGRLVDDAKLRAKLLPRSLAVGTAFATFLTAPSAEGRWLAVAAMLALTVFDGMANIERDSVKTYVLMPLIDSVNHKTMAKTDAEFEFSVGAFVLRSPRDYAAGSEVFISYGVLNNDELVTRYGFVDTENVADIYRFEGLLPYLQANHEPMKRALGADPSRLANLKRTHPALDEALWNGNFISDGNAENNLLWALRAVLATPEEFAAANGVEGFKLGGGAPEKRVALAIRQAVLARLADCPTTLEQDYDALKTAPKKGNMRTAIAYRIRKKRILRDAAKIYDVGGVS